MATVSLSGPPSFVRLAAHPVRWRLMGELARSDRRVGELVSLVSRPQNLVSYHLSRLRAERLVAARRSTYDSRDTYYRLDLAHCADALAAAGLALHPGLRMSPAPAVELAGPCRVLFLCTGNSARSPAAEALLRHRAAQVEVVSAGSHPKALHPNTARVLKKYGIELAGRSPQQLSTFERQRFDYVITLCDRVREVCPEFRGGAEQLHWSIPDPAASGGTDRDTYPAFERMMADLETRIDFLLAMMGRAPVRASVQEG
ncbi:MAG TPA: ArsR family transcriptional regulator [Streptosporangiaceae bacterium]|jgi:protein-tyrosine-phosphatase/DNA-binding transcriptional ArsR family regulator